MQATLILISLYRNVEKGEMGLRLSSQCPLPAAHAVDPADVAARTRLPGCPRLTGSDLT